MKDRNRENMELLAAQIAKRMSVGDTSQAIRADLYRTLAPQVKCGDGMAPEERTRHGKNLIYWCSRWVECGMPHVLANHRLAASLMATEIPQDFADHILPPWPCFMATIPGGLFGDAELSIFVDADHTAAHRCNDYTRVMFVDAFRSADGHDGLPWDICEHWKELGSFDYDTMNAKEGFRFTIGSGDDRATDRKRRLQMVLRFVFGACAELQNEGGGSGGGRSPPVDALRKAPDPTAWTFRLSRPVKLDVRDYVRGYVSGDRSSLKVQFMRRGHWRNQAYGPGSSLRKFIQIEPQWVGPEDAPIAVRPHILGAKEQSP